MSKYINADEIKDKAWKAESEACFYALEDVVSVYDIDQAPSIEIVRCKDCKWYRDFDGCFFSTAECEPEHFCSWGERIEECQ